jgi:hypothetical protein
MFQALITLSETTPAEFWIVKTCDIAAADEMRTLLDMVG